MSKPLTIAAVTLLTLAAFAFLLVSGLGSPISTDLTPIGKGKPVLVLAYQNYSPVGGAAFDRLSAVKDAYASSVEFRVADLGVAEGQAFARRHRLADGQAMLLGPDGTPLQRLTIPAQESELRRSLDAALESGG